jgi:hypothetical protein
MSTHPSSGGRRVAALYGRDLVDTTPDLDVVRLHDDGFELLALDRGAMSRLLELEIPFATVEDWLDEAGIPSHDLFDVAAAASLGWTRGRPQTLMTDGVLWPELDYWQVPDVWTTMLLTARLCRALAVSGVIELRFGIGYPESSSAAYKTPLPAVAEAFGELLPGIARPVPRPAVGVRRRVRDRISASPIGGPLRTLRGAVGTLRFLGDARRVGGDDAGATRILLMLPRRELDRSGTIVQMLREHFGDRVVALPWTASDDEARIAAELADGLPTVLLPAMERGYRRDERRLRRGVVASLEQHDLGELEMVRGPLVHALQYLASGWAAHARRLRWAVRVLRRLSPGVVVTAREALGYQVPREAARAVGSPVLTLPHGVVEWAPPRLLTPEPRTLHVAGIDNPTAPRDAMVVCHDALVRYEYPQRVRAIEGLGRGARFRVLALTDGYGSQDRPGVNMSLHRALLAQLARAARDCGPDVEFLLKPHPGGPDDERLLLAQVHDEAIEVLPREADVFALVATCDLVVGLNSLTSALVHAAAMGMPIVRWMTNPLHRAVGDWWSAYTSWNRFFEDHLASVGSADELVASIGRLRTEPAFVTGLEERSRRLTTRLRLDAPSVSLVEAVEQLLLLGPGVSGR